MQVGVDSLSGRQLAFTAAPDGESGLPMPAAGDLGAVEAGRLCVPAGF